MAVIADNEGACRPIPDALDHDHDRAAEGKVRKAQTACPGPPQRAIVARIDGLRGARRVLPRSRRCHLPDRRRSCRSAARQDHPAPGGAHGAHRHRGRADVAHAVPARGGHHIRPVVCGACDDGRGPDRGGQDARRRSGGRLAVRRPAQHQACRPHAPRDRSQGRRARPAQLGTRGRPIDACPGAGGRASATGVRRPRPGPAPRRCSTN